MEPDNPLLDMYILKQAKKVKPKICFIPTASKDSDSYISRYYNFFYQQDCNPSHLSLFKPSTRDLENFILDKDIIYVGGGNTKNLLALWKEWGLDNILRKAWNQGVILDGLSAGSICWFEEGITDSYGDGLEPIQCLVKKTIHPHQLRHSYATHMVDNGAPSEMIQSLLGHEKSEMTRIYAHLRGKLRYDFYKNYF